MTYGKQVQEELRPHARALRRMIPDVSKAFAALHDAALVHGALDTKTKELIALAIAMSSECDGCIAAHAHAAVRHGASPQKGRRDDRRELPDERRADHDLRAPRPPTLPCTF